MSIARQKVKPLITDKSSPAVQTYTLPASVGGINALDGLMTMPPTDCLYCHNLMPVEYGLTLRRGYTQWASNVGDPVNTLIPFEGQVADATQDRLWAATRKGIFNVTLAGTDAPVQEVTFADSSPAAGFGVWTEFTNDNNDRYLFYADEANGLHEYAETTEAWSVPAITGPDVTKIAFVTSWKNRLWFIERDSGVAWYLPVAAKAGVAKPFYFGSKFSHGGDLRSIFSWTIDGGAGIDDLFVATSRGGDVLIYKGYDPETVATFDMVGSFFIGELPDSRRLGVQYGGELYLLSTHGITSVRDLLQGAVSFNGGKSPAAKISRILRDKVVDGKDELNWALHVYPTDGFLQILTPYETKDAPIQLNQNLLTGAWGMWRDVPANCTVAWDAGYYIGDKSGNVWQYAGGVDRELLDNTAPEAIGVAIEFDLLTSFSPPGGDHANYKRVGFVRTIGVISGDEAMNIGVIYDYKLNAMLAPPSDSPTGALSIWDDAIWDGSRWTFNLAGVGFVEGSLGIGRTVAVIMRGTSTDRLTIIGWDLTYTQGTFL